MVALGDSKTLGANCCAGTHGYQDALAAAVGGVFVSVDATSGINVSQLRAGVDAWIATVTLPPQFALVNIGVNDISGGTQGPFESDLGYIADAIHAAWPSTRVLLAKPWRRGYDTQSTTMAGWVDNVLSARGPWAGVGPDENATPGLKNGDDGVTYTDDGVHPNAAGYALQATQWRTLMGL